MIARALLLVLAGMGGACSRSTPPAVAAPTPAPAMTAEETKPPTPVPVQLGEAPRMKQE